MNEKELTLKVKENGEWTIDLRTLEVDIANNVFKINGIDFGGRCIGFSVEHNAFGTTVYLEKNIVTK